MDELKTDQGKTNEHQELPMPLTSKDLIVLMRCLVLALELNQIKESDKEVVRNLAGRIKRYVERQGAYWDVNRIFSKRDRSKWRSKSGDFF